METKICKKCGIEKDIKEFRNKFEKRLNKSYLYSYCKECEKKDLKEYKINNKEKIAELSKKHNKKYNSNREYHNKYQKDYYKKHKDEISKKQNEYRAKKRKKDYLYKLKEQIRSLIWIAYKHKGFLKSKKTEKILGCNFEDFHNHLLQTFRDNYGYEYNFKEEVHIDHIIPLATAKTEDEVTKLNHYTNLQLLKAKDNMEKRDKLNWKLVI